MAQATKAETKPDLMEAIAFMNKVVFPHESVVVSKRVDGGLSVEMLLDYNNDHTYKVLNRVLDKRMEEVGYRSKEILLVKREFAPK
jgi:hypothetical protein